MQANKQSNPCFREKGIPHRALLPAFIGFWILAGWLLSQPLETRADMSSHFGLSPRAIGMANAGAAVMDDFSATYHNPAGLAMNPGSSFTLGYFYTSPRVKIRDPNGVEQLYLKEDTQTLVVGYQQNLKRLLSDGWNKNLVLGLAVASPNNLKNISMVKTYTYDYPQVPVFGRIADMVVMNAALGLELHRRLYVGAGMRFAATYDATNISLLVDVEKLEITNPPLVISTQDPAVTTQKVAVNADSEMMPIAGVLFKPWDQLRMAGVWRRGGAPIKLGGKGSANVMIGPFAVPASLGMVFQDFFTPTEISLSLAFEPMDKLLLAYEAVYSEWSEYDVPTGTTPPGDPFTDIWVHRFGAEYTFSDQLRVQAGYYYHPSPVKAYQPYTCYLDTDEHVFATAAEYALHLKGILKYPLKFQAYLQYQYLPERTLNTLGVETAIWGYNFNAGVMVQFQFM